MTKGDLGKRIAALRTMLVEEKDLEKISQDFHEHLADDDDFMRLGRHQANARLSSLVRGVVHATFADDAFVDQRIFLVPEFSLWHGGLIFATGRMAQVIYFSDVNRGLCTVVKLGDIMAHHMRFSIPEEMTEAINPEKTVLAGYRIRRGEAGASN